MANLTPSLQWSNVFQLETTTPILAGPGGPANYQAQSLLNRTNILSGLENVSQLRSLEKPTTSDTLIVTVKSVLDADTNFYTAQFAWNPSSTATDDGMTVINPLGNLSSGRWIRTVEKANSVSSGGVIHPYNVSFFFTTPPTSSEILALHTFAQQIIFKNYLEESRANVGINPTAAATLTIYKNNAIIGTVGISTTGTVLFDTTSADIIFVPGDLLKVVAQSTADPTLGNVSVTMLGYTDNSTLPPPVEVIGYTDNMQFADTFTTSSAMSLIDHTPEITAQYVPADGFFNPLDGTPPLIVTPDGKMQTTGINLPAPYNVPTTLGAGAATSLTRSSVLAAPLSWEIDVNFFVGANDAALPDGTRQSEYHLSSTYKTTSTSPYDLYGENSYVLYLEYYPKLSSTVGPFLYVSSYNAYLAGIAIDVTKKYRIGLKSQVDFTETLYMYELDSSDNIILPALGEFVFAGNDYDDINRVWFNAGGQHGDYDGIPAPIHYFFNNFSEYSNIMVTSARIGSTSLPQFSTDAPGVSGPPSTIGFASPTYSFAYLSSLEIPLVKSNDSSASVTMDVIDGTAVQGTDYRTNASEFYWLKGDGPYSTYVYSLNQAPSPPTEPRSFTLRLVAGENCSLGTSETVVTMLGYVNPNLYIENMQFADRFTTSSAVSLIDHTPDITVQYVPTNGSFDPADGGPPIVVTTDGKMQTTGSNLASPYNGPTTLGRGSATSLTRSSVLAYPLTWEYDVNFFAGANDLASPTGVPSCEFYLYNTQDVNKFAANVRNRYGFYSYILYMEYYPKFSSTVGSQVQVRSQNITLPPVLVDTAKTYRVKLKTESAFAETLSLYELDGSGNVVTPALQEMSFTADQSTDTNSIWFNSGAFYTSSTEVYPAPSVYFFNNFSEYSNIAVDQIRIGSTSNPQFSSNAVVSPGPSATIGFASSTYTTSHNNYMTIPITKSNDSSASITVQVIDGTAVHGVDFLITKTEFYWLKGNQFASNALAVNTSVPAPLTSNKSFTLRIIAVDNCTISTSDTVVTITP